MAKALMGTSTTPRSIELLDEVRALRRRVSELEQALARAESAQRARGSDPELVVELAERDAEAVRS